MNTDQTIDNDIHILIVDDDPDIRNLLHKFVKIAGYNTSLVSSAEEALDLLKTKNFSVVLTDIVLPGKNGLELTDLIKKDYDTDVIVITGSGKKYSYEDAVSKGASDIIFKPIRFKELILRLKKILKERHLTQERYNLIEKLKKLAITDGLTDLFNSRHFYSQLEVEIDRSNRYKPPLSLLLLDIDNFKIYNDTYGHLEGDKVLFRLGQIIKSCLRKMDSAYRYGGEEFTVILPETGGKEALNVAQRIRTTIEVEKFIPEPKKAVSITISIGVTEFYPKEEITGFIQRADKAMYMSKQKGRNRVSSLFTKEPHQPY